MSVRTNGAPPTATDGAPATLAEAVEWVQVIAATGRNLLPVTESLLREKFALKVATEARLQALRVLFHQHAQHRLPLSGHLLLTS